MFGQKAKKYRETSRLMSLDFVLEMFRASTSGDNERPGKFSISVDDDSILSLVSSSLFEIRTREFDVR